jgi:uncharacterized membrane protein AbrB (regulator of aidB expression)
MTMVYYAGAGICAAVTTSVMLNMLGVPRPLELGATLAVGIVAMMVWSYSPLPDHNGGMLAGTENTGWGWGSDE